MLTELCPFTRTSRCALQAPAQERFSFFSTIEAAAADWDIAAPTSNVFLSRRYLKALEEGLPPGMRLGYLVFYLNDMPIGVALLQRVSFEGGKHLRHLADNPRRVTWLQHLLPLIKRQLVNGVRGQVLTCGNLLLTGKHGFYFDPKAIAPQQAMTLLLRAIQEIAQRWRPAAVLLKDISPECSTTKKVFIQARYTSFRIQPSMVLPLPYPTFEDYLSAMTTKYRTRAKRAFTKASTLERHRLNLRELREAQERLYALYTSVARRSGFHWIDLHEEYLLALQRHLRDAFHCIGWYRQGQLVGFHTAIENDTSLEAHFLGYEEAVNAECQLYLNMLYDLVRLGIECGSERVVFGRTALEIKSSVGAQPQEFDLYLQLQHSLGRHLCTPLLRCLVPVTPWEQRHPFKKRPPEGSHPASAKCLAPPTFGDKF